MAKLCIWIKFRQLLHRIELDEREARAWHIVYIELHALQVLALACSVERLHVDRTELGARQIEGVHALCKLVGVNPVGADKLERQGVANADRNVVKLAENTGGWIIERRGWLWNMR